MQLWTLTRTLLTGPLAAIGNPDFVCDFRIEIFRSADDAEDRPPQYRPAQYRAVVSRSSHFDLNVSFSASGEVATETLYTIEESFGCDDLRATDEASLIAQVQARLLQFFEEQK